MHHGADTRDLPEMCQRIEPSGCASKDMEPQVGNCLFYGFGMLAKARLLRQNAKFEERISAYEREAVGGEEDSRRPDDATLQ